jgi:hypothetical protein
MVKSMFISEDNMILYSVEFRTRMKSWQLLPSIVPEKSVVAITNLPKTMLVDEVFFVP